MNWDSFICLSLLMVGGFFTKLISPMTLYTNRSVKIKFLEAMAERAHGFVKPQPEASRGNSSWNIPLPFLGFGSFRCSDERPPKPSSGERREALTKKTKNVRTVDGKAAFYQNLEPHVLQAFGVILVVICKVCFTMVYWRGSS